MRAPQPVHLSGGRSADTIKASGRDTALTGRIHDRKRRLHHQHSTKSLQGWGRSIHVILFEQDGADQADDGGLVWKEADDIGAAFDLLVQPFQRVGGMQFCAVLGGKVSISIEV